MIRDNEYICPECYRPTDKLIKGPNDKVMVCPTCFYGKDKKKGKDNVRKLAR